jgi:hypothetical protein
MQAIIQSRGERFRGPRPHPFRPGNPSGQKTIGKRGKSNSGYNGTIPSLFSADRMRVKISIIDSAEKPRPSKIEKSYFRDQKKTL